MFHIISAVLRCCHRRVCIIALASRHVVTQLLFGFESKQKIDMLNSISFVFLGYFSEQTEKLASEKFRTILIMILPGDSPLGKSWDRLRMPLCSRGRGSSQMHLSRGLLTQQSSSAERGTLAVSPPHIPAPRFGSALTTGCLKEPCGADVAGPWRTEMMAAEAEAIALESRFLASGAQVR